MAIHNTNEMTEKVEKEPAGISKFEVIWRSMVLVSRTLKGVCVAVTDIITPVDHIGITFSRAFSSSTSSMVQRFHGFMAFPSGVSCSSAFPTIVQALFKKLQNHSENHYYE